MRRITSNNVGLIQKTIAEKLAGAEKELGVSIHLGLTTLTPHNAIFKLETAVVGEDGEIKAQKLIVNHPENESFMVVDRDTGEIVDTGFKTVADAAVSWPTAVNAPGVVPKAE
jgi:hypothetical protein